jgi:hypothetical protein
VAAASQIATKTERSQTDLLTEAIDDLAVKYGEQPKEPTGKKTSRHDPSP